MVVTSTVSKQLRDIETSLGNISNEGLDRPNYEKQHVAISLVAGLKAMRRFISIANEMPNLVDGSMEGIFDKIQNLSKRLTTLAESGPDGYAVGAEAISSEVLKILGQIDQYGGLVKFILASEDRDVSDAAVKKVGKAIAGAEEAIAGRLDDAKGR